MQPIHLNFDSDINPLDNLPDGIELIGNPYVRVDAATDRNACYFDGNSAIVIPQFYLGDENFSIEAMFTPATELEERGIFGSNGFRLAFRQDRKLPSVSFFAHFPSSIDPKKTTFQNGEDWYNEHYVGIRREGSTFTVRYDDQISQIEYNANYGSLPLYLGYFYDKLYSYIGYIRQFRMEFQENASDVRRPIDGTIF